MNLRDVLLVALPAAALTVGVAACDTGARKDLSDENQTLDEGEAVILLFPDRFPNVAHKCYPESTIGVWTVTDRFTWIVYNDPECGGEGPIFILDNVPGGDVANEAAAESGGEE